MTQFSSFISLGNISYLLDSSIWLLGLTREIARLSIVFILSFVTNYPWFADCNLNNADLKYCTISRNHTTPIVHRNISHNCCCYSHNNRERVAAQPTTAAVSEQLIRTQDGPQHSPHQPRLRHVNIINWLMKIFVRHPLKVYHKVCDHDF